MSKATTLIRISDSEHSHVFNVATEDAALDKYAAERGCTDFASLANGVYEKTVEQAKDGLRIETITLREALAEIIDETLESDAKDDGAEDPFKSSRDWARWCWEGKTGDDAKVFGREHGIDEFEIKRVVLDALEERDLDDINAPFEPEEVEERDALNSPTVDDAISAWKRATTQADRDLAEEAIGQHIAHETPEEADYEAATDELIARLKAEFGPVPTEDLRSL